MKTHYRAKYLTLGTGPKKFPGLRAGFELIFKLVTDEFFPAYAEGVSFREQ